MLDYFKTLYSKQKHREHEINHLIKQLKQISDKIILPELPAENDIGCTTVARITSTLKAVLEEETAFDMYYTSDEKLSQADTQTRIDSFFRPVPKKNLASGQRRK